MTLAGTLPAAASMLDCPARRSAGVGAGARAARLAQEPLPVSALQASPWASHCLKTRLAQEMAKGNVPLEERGSHKCSNFLGMWRCYRVMCIISSNCVEDIAPSNIFLNSESANIIQY